MSLDPTTTAAPPRAYQAVDARLILDSAVDCAIIAMNLAGVVTFWSEGARRALGWTATEMLGRPASAVFTMEDRRNGVPQAEMQNVLAQGRGDDERWYLRQDGTSFWAHGEMMPLRDETGLLQGFIKVLRDRTAQQQAAGKQRADAALLRSLLASSADCIAVLDLVGRLEFMTEGGRRAIDVDGIRAIEGCSWPNLWRGPLRTDAQAAIEVATAGGRGHFRGLADAGTGTSRFWDVQVTPILGADGRPEKLLAVSRDLSELRKSEAHWHSLFDKLQEGVVLGELVRDHENHVTDWRCLDVNPAWARLVGREPEAVAGRSIRELVPTIEESWVEDMAAVVETGRVSTFTRQVGALGWYEGRAFPLEGDRFVVLFVEVTERRQTDARRDALLTLNDRLRDMSDEAAMSFAAASLLGETLGVDGVGYGTVSVDGGELDVARDWTAPGTASVAGRHRMRQYGTYIEDLRRGERVVIADARLDPRTMADAGALETIGARALLNLPIVEHGRLAALLFINCAEPRAWTAHDVSFVRNMAERTRSAVERVRAESSRRESEEQFRVFAQAMPNHVWAGRSDGYLYWFNDQVYDYCGAERGSMDGAETWARVVHPDDLAAAGAAWGGALANGTIYETQFRIRRRDGVYRWFLVRAEPVRDADGRITRWVGTNTDIDDQRRQAAELARLNAMLEEEVAVRTRERDRVWTTTSDLMGTAGFDGYLKQVNPAWTRMLGWSEAALLKTPFIERIDPADHQTTADVVRRLAAGETVTDFMDQVFHADGTQRTIMWNASPDGALFNIVGRDVTALRRSEEALRQSQKMEAVGQLTGGLAHDFNNLLTGITGSLDLLTTRIAQGRLNDIERYTVAAQSAAKRAAALTHRLLAFSRRQTLAPKPTDMNRLVAGMEDLVRRTIGPSVGLETVAAGGLWSTLVDPPQLENALLNLCINARDAMPDGGRLTIETGNRWLDARAARERELPPGQYVSLCVSDNGTGMPPEVIAKAFEPFFTTKPIGQGTGLGLSMIYGFARQSGGQVRIYSEPGDGTMVCLYLPRHLGDAPEVGPPPDLSDAPRAQAGETVLVVDDEPTVRMLVTEILEELGYAAIEAADGPSGLRVLESDARIDLLITDVGLPGGMNGRQVADSARRVRPRLKVLFITGYAENAVLNQGHLDPGMHVLTKPFAMDELAGRIKELIAAP